MWLDLGCSQQPAYNIERPFLRLTAVTAPRISSHRGEVGGKTTSYGPFSDGTHSSLGLVNCSFSVPNWVVVKTIGPTKGVVRDSLTR